MNMVAESEKVLLANSDKLFSEDDPSPDAIYRGRDACFIKLDDSWAIKVFTRGATRNKAYKYQAKAAEHGLGPDVGPSFDIETVDTTYYCYITEVVELVYDTCYYYDCPDWNEPDWVIEAKDDCEANWGKEAEELKHELKEKIGFDFLDSFPPNWGLKNGKLICIDFA